MLITSGEVVRLPKGASLPVTLKVLEYELFHFCPVKVRLPKEHSTEDCIQNRMMLSMNIMLL